MPTQTQIADHLDMSQQAVAELLARLGIDWTAAGLDAIRVAYIRHLRGQAAGHKSEDGLDLVRERVLTERLIASSSCSPWPRRRASWSTSSSWSPS